MGTYYNIVPVNDGHHYMAMNINKECVRFSKEEDYVPTLVFKTKENCSEYISKFLSPDSYIPEEIWLNEKYYSNLPE